MFHAWVKKKQDQYFNIALEVTRSAHLQCTGDERVMLKRVLCKETLEIRIGLK
jgi:hypothetical protein